MMVARGTAAHSSHALHVSNALRKTALNKTSYNIKEPEKLKGIAAKLKLDTSNGVEKTAIEVASIANSDILGDEISMRFATSYCPAIVGKNLLSLGVIPCSVGKELLEEGHETSMGTMTDPTSLILHAARLGVADIASLIIGSEFQDVLFGVPKPVFSITFDVSSFNFAAMPLSFSGSFIL